MTALVNYYYYDAHAYAYTLIFINARTHYSYEHLRETGHVKIDEFATDIFVVDGNVFSH